MFSNFFEQVEAADVFGYGTAWIAESHLSTEVQKSHANPVVPHWQGEIGLNTDIFQMAHRVFTDPQHSRGFGGHEPGVQRRTGCPCRANRGILRVARNGPTRTPTAVCRVFGRSLSSMNRAYGIVPRNDVEAPAALRGRCLAACEIFLRLLRGDVLSSDDVRETR